MSGSLGKTILGALAVALGTAILMWIPPPAPSRPPAFAGTVQEFRPAAVPLSAPFLAMLDSEGRPTELAALKGKVVVLNLWATWCVPCLAEMPALDRLAAKLSGPDFMVAALSLDRGGKPVVDPFVAKLGLKHIAIYLDPPNAAAGAFKVRGIPTTILLDRAGRELGRLDGPAEWDSPSGMALMRHYIAAGR